MKYRDNNLERVLEINEDAVLNIIDGNVSLKIPASFLKDDINKAIAIFKRYLPNSLTPIYDFSPDGYEDILTTTFDKEVYITFKVDPTQVKNWDHVEINDFDNGDFEIKTINKNEGFITISTKTLGTYNVMEVEPNEDETVTDVVYNVYADFSDKVVDEKTNEIVLDYTNKYVDTDKLSVTFTPAQIETVYQQQKNAKVVVKDKYVSTKLPVSLLKSNDRVTFVTVPKFDQEGALCPVIDFTIVTADGQKITNFEEIPITLTFLINPILVKDWNDVKVVYLDENGQMKEILDANIRR